MNARDAEAPLKVVQRSDCVRELRLNRPDKANALTPALVSELLGALTAAYVDGTRMLVLSGEGKNFCAGFDRTDEHTLEPEKLVERTIAIETVLQLLWHAPFVTMARVQGAAFGAGADIVAACDYRLGEPGSRFAFPGFRAFGVSLGTRRLAELVGGDKAFDLVLNNRRLSCEEAHTIGLITQVMEKAPAEEMIGRLGEEVGKVKKQSIAVLREATRGSGAGANSDIERVARSIMHATAG